ncbi:MAG: prepilin peptidase [Candidatus Omnitrophota bacterium]|nr:MAG: prepilin peptidase [Candidatus Omnitrophota bacterium]
MNIFIFVLGSCVGSFLNVCIYRLPKNISILRPFSFCPKCRKPLKWYDNIPILGYIFLKGRCRFCKEKISLRYPMVELLAGLLFLFLYVKFGFTLDFFKYTFLFCLCIVISFIDIEYFSVPVYLCFLGIGTGLFIGFLESIKFLKVGMFDFARLPVYESAKGIIFGLGFTYLFKLFGDIFLNIYLAVRKKESIEGEKESLGLGDVDFMGMVGAFLGVKAVLFVFFIAPFLGLIYVVGVLIFKRSHLIPYLPYLSLATLIQFLWADKILSLIF